MIDSIENGIIGIIPKYTDTGDSTYVLTMKGKGRSYEMSIRTFLRKLYYIYTIDLIAQKNKFKKIGIHQNAPLILDDQVFIKVRVRKPIGKSDGAYGYVNVKAVEKIIKEDGMTVLVMVNGEKLVSMDSYGTLSKNLMIGRSLIT